MVKSIALRLKSIPIFDYQAYREFIKDYVELQRNLDLKFSYIYYSKAIKASDSYLKLVVNGKRSLNLDKANLLASKFKLKPVDTSYFLTLIMLESAQSESMKQYYQDILLNYKGLSMTYGNKHPHTISVFNDILSWELFSLIGVDGFRDDPEWIIKKLNRRGLNKTLISKTFENLIHKNIVKKLPNNKYKANDLVLEDGKDVRYAYSLALDRAKEHLHSEFEEKSSYFDSFCLILSEDQKDSIKRLLSETRGKIAEIAKRKEAKSFIAFLNMNFFQASV